MTHSSTSIVPANIVQPGIRVFKLDQENPACILYQISQICRNVNARRTNHCGRVLGHHASLDSSRSPPPSRCSLPPLVLPWDTSLSPITQQQGHWRPCWDRCHAGCWRNLLVPWRPCVLGTLHCSRRSYQAQPRRLLITVPLDTMGLCITRARGDMLVC